MTNDRPNNPDNSSDSPDENQDEFNAFLPLPKDSQWIKQAEENPAVEMIRKKVEAAYAKEPSAKAEVAEIEDTPKGSRLSKHQKFVQELINSGKSVEEIQVAWHDYYAGLSDEQKHNVWQEFYAAQAATKSAGIATKQTVGYHPRRLWLATPERRLPKPRLPKSVHSLLFGVSMGIIVILIVLFSFFNERFIAPLIQPSRSLNNVPLITEGAPVGPNPEVIIPKINVEIPVVYGVNTIDEDTVLTALNDGVVHYADTALPGQDGNVVIVGHSSNNIFNPGKYKFAFVLLSRLEPGDTFYLQKDGKRYSYEVYKKQIVKPTDVSVLGPADKPAAATLVTCDPPGTSINRLVVTGEQISPDPSTNAPSSTSNTLATQAKIVPGNSESLWSRFWKWMSR